MEQCETFKTKERYFGAQMGQDEFPARWIRAGFKIKDFLDCQFLTGNIATFDSSGITLISRNEY